MSRETASVRSPTTASTPACTRRTRETVSSSSSIPSSLSAAASSSEASASARPAILPRFTTITREPKREKICANSSPTGPPPTTSSDSGSSVRSSALTWSTQSTSSIPSIGGTAVREPVAIRIRSPESSRPSTRRVRASTNVATPVTGS